MNLAILLTTYNDRTKYNNHHGPPTFEPLERNTRFSNRLVPEALFGSESVFTVLLGSDSVFTDDGR